MKRYYRYYELKTQWERTNGQELSYRKISEMTGISTATIAKIIENKSVSLETIEKLACFFGVAPNDFIAYR